MGVVVPDERGEDEGGWLAEGGLGAPRLRLRVVVLGEEWFGAPLLGRWLRERVVGEGWLGAPLLWVRVLVRARVRLRLLGWETWGGRRARIVGARVPGSRNAGGVGGGAVGVAGGWGGPEMRLGGFALEAGGRSGGDGGGLGAAVGEEAGVVAWVGVSWWWAGRVDDDGNCVEQERAADYED